MPAGADNIGQDAPTPGCHRASGRSRLAGAD